MKHKVEFIESYIKIGNDYKWNDNHGELIRCKDCKWLGVANLKDKNGQPNPVACCRGNGNIRLGITPDDYCSKAERKEE